MIIKCANCGRVCDGLTTIDMESGELVTYCPDCSAKILTEEFL